MAPNLVFDICDARIHRILVACIKTQKVRVTASVAKRLGLALPVFLQQIEDYNCRAFSAKALRDGKTDAARAARNRSDLALQSHGLRSQNEPPSMRKLAPVVYEEASLAR